jgi:prepilin-type N-terminal cleavage/methylation domain-containing protein
VPASGLELALIYKRSCGGFTLIELALVMGVIGSIMGAIWWASENAREIQRQNSAVSELQLTSQNIIALMQGQPFAIATNSNITSAMITAQAVPGNYVDSGTPTTADNPWFMSGGFVVQANTTNSAEGAVPHKIFRLSFYHVSYQGCLALILQGTSCQAGQAGCPFDVFTDVDIHGPTPVAPATNWATQMSPTLATTLCNENPYPGATNSVEFDFKL